MANLLYHLIIFVEFLKSNFQLSKIFVVTSMSNLANVFTLSVTLVCIGVERFVFVYETLISFLLFCILQVLLFNSDIKSKVINNDKVPDITKSIMILLDKLITYTMRGIICVLLFISTIRTKK